MKLHHLLLAALFALPARAADLPTWTPRETGWGGWISVSFVDANGQGYQLRCNYMECGNGKETGRAKLYEFAQHGEQVPFEYCDGPFWNRRCNTAYRTTFNTKLSNWELDMAKRKAVQGTQEASFFFGSDISALGSTIIVNPPTARRDDVFKPKAPTPAPVTGGPRRRPAPAPANPNLNTLDWKLFGEAMTMTDGGESRHLERTWLSFAEYAEHKSTCYNEDKPACRTAVAAARAKISANMRTTVAFENKTYKQAYDDAIKLRGDARATAIISILNLLLGEEYGSKNRPDEVMLNAAEKARLTAATAGLVTTSKTGKALLEEYEAALGRLDAKDHVGRWQLTKKYRLEVPAAGAVAPGSGPTPPVAGPVTSDKPLTPAERERLSADEREAYDRGIAAPSEAARNEAIRRARQWLADHPTAAEFAALDAAGKLRICKDFWAKESANGGAAAAATVTPALPQAQAAVANPDGIMTGDVRRDAPAVATSPAAPANRGYQWPPEIRDECQRLLGSGTPRVVLNPSEPVPNPTNTAGNLTVGKPIGKPTEKESAKKPPLTSWNPLLNGAKGGILGAIVGFVLGGPVGMLVGAAVFGVAAWGLSKIGDA